MDYFESSKSWGLKFSSSTILIEPPSTDHPLFEECFQNFCPLAQNLITRLRFFGNGIVVEAAYTFFFSCHKALKLSGTLQFTITYK